MNKVYIFAPLAGMILFGIVFFSQKAEMDRKAADQKARIETERVEKAKREADARRKALEEALVAQAKRKAEREAKAAADKAEREERQALIDARAKADREQNQLLRRINEIEKELGAEKEELEKLLAQKKFASDEKVFLAEFIKKARENQKSLEAVLNKIAQADAQIKAAADAAAAAAQKKS